MYTGLDIVQRMLGYSVQAYKLGLNLLKLFNPLDMVKRCYKPILNVLDYIQPEIGSQVHKNIVCMHTSLQA